MEFSTRSMKNLIQQNTEKRVSDDAGNSLGDFLDRCGEEIAEDAIEVANEDGRKTVRAEDIREALSDRKDRTVEQSLSL